MVTDKPKRTPLQHSTNALAERNAAMKARLDGVASMPRLASQPSLPAFSDPATELVRGVQLVLDGMAPPMRQRARAMLLLIVSA